MKYVDEFRQPKLVQHLSKELHRITTKSWTVMEVCGGQTHTIVKFGLHALLPQNIRLIHGPGCPVCVTPIHMIEQALHIASQPGVIFCSYGDMLRVPGNAMDLLRLRAKGADVRIVLSPLEALKLAKDNPLKQVVFFAVGFETTAPANAMAAYQAKERGLSNFSMLVSHVLVPPALQFILSSPGNEVDGLLAAGHVCTVTGNREYHALSERYKAPIIITGFEPVDILQGLFFCIRQLESGKRHVHNQYHRCVMESGNVNAQVLVNKVFRVSEREWRGIGSIPNSGFCLKEEYADFDAALRFPMHGPIAANDNGCISGLILQGKKKPCECPLFSKKCTPENPLGAPMVSNEGACSVYYQYSQKI